MDSKGKLLGIDFGERRIGLAISDLSQTLANGYTTIDTRKHPDPLSFIDTVIREQKIVGIVMGYPERTDGKPGGKIDVVDNFILKLESRFKLPVHRQDESYSSVRANEILRTKKAREKKTGGKGLVDKFASTIILQDFLNEKV